MAQLCEWITQGPNPVILDEGEAGIPCLTGRNIRGHTISTEGADVVSDREFSQFPRFHLRKGDILVTLKGAGSTGKMALVESSTPMMFSRNVGIIRLPADMLDLAEFVYAYFSSSYGQELIDRGVTGGTGQLTLPTGYLKRVPIPRFLELAKRATEIIAESKRRTSEANACLSHAEKAVLLALGLEDWQPPEPLTYTGSASEALAAGRIDSDFFAPARTAAIAALAALPHRLLKKRCDAIREMFNPTSPGKITAVRNFDITDALKPSLDDSKEPVPVEEVGSMKKLMKPGDLAVSRLRWYLKEIAVVRTTSEVPTVGSSEFIVLRPRAGVDAEVLMVFLRSFPVQTILKYCQEGNQHPRFHESNLLSIPVPDVLIENSSTITQHIRAAHTARHEARELLDRAKRAVEIAIEQGEAKALAYISDIEL